VQRGKILQKIEFLSLKPFKSMHFKKFSFNFAKLKTKNRMEGSSIRWILVLFTVTLLAMGACAEQVDIEAEKAKIQSVLDQLVQAWETEDMEMISKIWAHDEDMVIFSVYAGADRFVGGEAYKEFYIEWLEAVENIDVSVRDQVIKVNASGNTAWFSEIEDWNWVA